MMTRKLGAIVLAVALLPVLLGCSSLQDLRTTPSVPTPRIVREAKIAGKWELRQISLDLGPGDEAPILLKLADGDKVDGYFYLESGKNVDFKITGSSVLYQPKPPDNAKGLNSDRFSFTASQAQGTSYTITVRNTATPIDKPPNATIFLEIIYPTTGTLFTLLEK